MSVTQRNETVQEDGQDKQAHVFSFTNGAKEQIEELRQHFHAPSTLDVIKLGISVLQRMKELEEKEKKATPNEPQK